MTGRVAGVKIAHTIAWMTLSPRSPNSGKLESGYTETSDGAGLSV